ncbi:hypothetical protein [Gordonia sp. (in: high G+C Gram-positive bacteria)]|uniref:hypothetical protein n=1 Tax=Gordonia sp. (in: high G+C Gram-positive bacteria) TaxID=84139 RepID=UPI003340303A
MDVSDDQARLIVYVTAEFVRRRQLTGQPIPEQVRRLLAEASAYGTSERPREQHSEPDLIDTETAAAILHCTSRNIRRIATDLDGEQVAGRWIFHRATVTEYAHLKQGA